MKRREPEGAHEFLRRPEETWRRITPHANPVAFALLQGFAGVVLARRGELSPAEVERLQTIAAGAEDDPPITPESARHVLSRRRAA